MKLSWRIRKFLQTGGFNLYIGIWLVLFETFIFFKGEITLIFWFNCALAIINLACAYFLNFRTYLNHREYFHEHVYDKYYALENGGKNAIIRWFNFPLKRALKDSGNWKEYKQDFK